ncbi:MAG TPA: iron uptake transporter deferrochelatase/peroxidase subunit [Roseomonas sp.]|jgi:deferrochelatase/peroxidase EfeB
MSQGSCPFAAGRRGLLLGLAGGAGVIAGGSPAMAAEAAPPEVSAIPFHGPHQAGIVTPPPAAAIIAAFDVLVQDRAGLEQLFRILTERIGFLMAGGTPPAADPRFPPADSGVLGPHIQPESLTVTLAIGASLFDARYGLAALKPVHLQVMRRFPNDALEREWCHGDLLLQICGRSPLATVHALRALVRATPDLLRLRWKLDGTLPAERLETPRNLLGFKDGTANLDAADARLMQRHVWVRPEDGEPAWAEGGSYQVVRIIRNFVERWDRTPLGEQERIFGRDKEGGAPLGQAREKDIPDYASDPQGLRIPLDAHIRRANPRTPDTAESLILRRPFNYSRGVTRAGQLDMGLLFVCFQRNLANGFIAVQERLNGEPLEEYIRPTGGGYFFALPGVADAAAYLGQALLESA